MKSAKTIQLLTVVLIVAALPLPFGNCDEPSKRFLERMKEEGHYDEALQYLEISSKRDRLPESMKADLELERVLLLQESLKQARTGQQAEKKIASIEKGLRDFLAKAPEHPRRSETQITLGTMFMNRGQKLLDDGKKASQSADGKSKADEDYTKARAEFTEANVIFNAAINDLKPVLEKMKGNNVKADEKELREQFQINYRQAEILLAIGWKLIAETYAAESPEWKSNLDQADKKLADIIDKSSGGKQAGAKFYSLLNRGQVQTLLGQIDAARESFNRVADNEEPGAFRTMRIQAISGIVRLDGSAKSGKFEAAIQRGQETLKTSESRDKDKDKSEWQELQFVLAEALIAWNATLDPKKDNAKIQTNRREARELLQNLIKKPNDYQVKARGLLKEIGVEAKVIEDIKLPTVRSFDEAIKEGRLRLDRAESTDPIIEIKQREFDAAPQGARAAIQQELDDLKTASVRDRSQAIELYQRALKLYKDSDSREELLQTRYLISYLYLKNELYWEAVAVAQVVMRSAKGSETGTKSAAFALMGLGRLIDAAPTEEQEKIKNVLEELAKYMVATAPGTPECDQAIDILVRLSLREERWDDAYRYIKMQGKIGSPLAFKLGRIFWSKYRQIEYQNRKNQMPLTPADLVFKERAEELLAESWKSLTPDQADMGSIEGSNDLVSVYLQSNRLVDAEQVLNDPLKGVLKLSTSVADVDPKVKLEALRLNLQALVQSAALGRRALDKAQVAAQVDEMVKLAASTNDPSMLTKSLQSLAAEVQNQLVKNNNPNQQATLAETFQILIDQLVGVSEDPSTLDSCGAAANDLATNLKKLPGLASNATGLMQAAEKAYTKLKNKKPEELEKIHRKPEEIILRLALAKSGAGKFSESHPLFVEALKKNPNNITLQMEAARNLQQWAGNKDLELIRKAIAGTEPGQGGKNVIWGWGEIAKAASKNQNFREQLYESRFNLAVCREIQGDTETDPKNKQKAYENGIKEITQVAVMFQLKLNPKWLQEFDTQMRSLQKKAGQPVVGI